ncbi:MAG: polysaccharide deacetylase family protein [Acidobacteriota bacterium]|nr:MAG: polysaccharide deacetylase family protein [Acidobacteriota bacterium]
MVGDRILPQLLNRFGLARGVSILMYHSVVDADLPFRNWCVLSAETFRAHVEFLKCYADVIPLSAVGKRLAQPSKARPAVVITFDDGYRNNFDVAFPILKDAGLPATVFLTTGLIGTKEMLWDSRLYLAIASARNPSIRWDGVNYTLTGAQEKAHCFTALKAWLKPFAQDQFEEKLGQIIGQLDTDRDGYNGLSRSFEMLWPEQVTEMVDSGLIEFGGHTHSHSILERLDQAERRHEIETSVREVARLTCRPCRSFAYPNGKREDYTTDCLDVLRDCGVEVAVTTVEQPATGSSDLLELGRYPVGVGTGLTRLRLKVFQLEQFLRR